MNPKPQKFTFGSSGRLTVTFQPTPEVMAMLESFIRQEYPEGRHPRGFRSWVINEALREYLLKNVEK